METSDLRSASGLQRVRHMKRVAVAMLAMVVVSGCGVGADERYDGQTLVGADGQALETGPQADPTLAIPAIPQTPVTAASAPVYDPGTVALPQDPIPVHQGRPAGPLLDPMVGRSSSPGGR